VDIYESFELDTYYLGCLRKLKQYHTIEDYMSFFEKLYFHTEVMLDTFFRECFISCLKEEICAQVLMHFPTTWLEDSE
jgi:hypothetical protein